MAQIQELIEKIKSEGIAAADQKAKQIEDDAQKKAAQIVDKAQKDAAQLLSHAKEETKKLQESTEMALKQAARDTILSLKKEIQNVLNKIVIKQTSDSLTPEALVELLVAAAKSSGEKGDVTVTLNSKDAESLESGFLSKLQKEIKGTLKLQASDDVSRGLLISFDNGKSSFDLTDQSLAKYIGSYLNSSLAELVEKSG